MTALREGLRWAAEYVLGAPRCHKLSYNLARIGLHGLGVGLPSSPEKSGEHYFLKRFLSACDSSVAVDVGGNVGDYTKMLLELGAKHVVIFEPVPASVAAISKRFGGDRRVTVRNQAVGESVGRIELNVPSDSATSVLASRGMGATAFTAAPMDVLEVPMTTLDDAMAELEITPDFLKIDVEGFESEVLAGAQRLIASHCLKAIQIEFSFHHLLRGTTLLTFERNLPGYRIFRLASRSLREIDPKHYLGTIYGYSNFIALRPDVAEKLKAMI